VRQFQRQGARVRVSRGSGFLVHPEGLVVTSEHVVTRRPGAGRATLTVVVDEGGPGEAAYPARLAHFDAGGDIAVLRLLPPFRPLPALPLGARDDLRAGTDVRACGYPAGAGYRAAPGVVVRLLPGSAVRREWLVATAPVRDGCSGGPLLDGAGRVLGVVARRGVWTTDEPGFPPRRELTHAVPVDYLRRRLETWRVPLGS